MIEWLGPKIFEYYASTEGVGVTGITSEEWLKKPGSVGKPAWGPIHICEEDGTLLGPDQPGLIYFEVPEGRDVSYLNDPEKAKRARHPLQNNWFTVGDIGKLDADGYLFLTDRKDFMIISGGVNIYPQAVEDCPPQGDGRGSDRRCPCRNGRGSAGDCAAQSVGRCRAGAGGGTA